ncbi:MAG: thiol-disulfide isomerase/thioredoxin [Roseivirga sp.]|jgi:thiol-disulfide isomerase/thioredoxin
MIRLRQVIGLGLIALLFGCNNTNEEKVFFDKLDLKTMDGKALTVAELEGKMAFVNVWATWCGPCLKEMPSIERAKAKLESEGYVFIAISNEEHDKIENFIAKNDYTFDFAELGMGLEALNVYSLPASYIIDGKGNLVYQHMGAKEWDSPENISMFKSLLKK